MNWLNAFIQWGFLVAQFITAVLAIRCWNRRYSFTWKFFIAIWVLTFLTEMTGKILAAFHIQNLWLYNFFNIIFYPAVLLLYADVFAKNPMKWWSIVIAVLLVIWQVVHLVLYQNQGLDTYYITVASTAIIFFSVSYLIQLFLDKNITTPLRQDFYYWFSAGFIIYFSFSAVMLGMYNTILQSKISWLPLFIFYANHLITFVLHLCLWAGFRAAYKWMK
ncbi:MAG: hypothetical protein HYX40_06035 [Sphingobacteriales bacterium]|nr:hypothetical protein [Sphingobacteriales bacterium]